MNREGFKSDVSCKGTERVARRWTDLARVQETLCIDRQRTQAVWEGCPEARRPQCAKAYGKSWEDGEVRVTLRWRRRPSNRVGVPAYVNFTLALQKV